MNKKPYLAALTILSFAHASADDLSPQNMTPTDNPTTVNTLATSNMTSDTAGETLSAKLSTLGLSVEYTYPINSDTEIGISANYLAWPTVSINKTAKHPAHKFSITTASLGIVEYYYPWQEYNLNIGAGLFYNRNKFAAQVEDHGHWEANETFNPISPAISIGWRSKADSTTFGDSSLSYGFDLGIMYQGTPKMTITQKPKPCGSPTFPCEALEKVIKQHVHDHTDGFRFWPILSAGLTYRF